MTKTKETRTAGKTAKKSNATWRTVATSRGLAARSPDGRLYYGTPAEVREAALMPWRRKMLADSLRFIRYYAESGHDCDREELAEWAKSKRRDAIQAGSHDSACGVGITIPAEVYIRLVAGARLLGHTKEEFFTEVWESQVTGILDYADHATGKREIPLTRHERDALARCAAKVV